jgi:predicted dehydrogenase
MVRIGIVGLGVMGTNHAKSIIDGNISGAELTAVCDINPLRLEWAEDNLGGKVHCFSKEQEIYTSGEVDGVIISNYHYCHPGSAIKALKCGLHVLIEKPAGVFVKQVREMNDVAVSSRKVFGIVYNQRTNPLYRKVKDLVESSELGELKRISWTVTSWYRTQCYYDSCDWRATWQGEGGGVLINQSPHQLDLLQWICGMPARIKSFCSYGKYHDIEVEDEVTAFLEYDNGATGVFVTSTGEAPGTNRFEIAGDKGNIVVENDKLVFYRLRMPEREFNRTCKDRTIEPEYWKCDISVQGENTQHDGIMNNWISAITKGEPLIAPGIEGIYGLQISNAIHLSDWTKEWVSLPANEELYFSLLKQKVAQSSCLKINVIGRV